MLSLLIIILIIHTVIALALFYVRLSKTLDEIIFSEYLLGTFEESHQSYLKQFFKTATIRYVKELNGDKDVYGELYRVYVECKFLRGIKISVADYFIYYEKSYKNKKELIWRDKGDSRGRNFLEKPVLRLMRVIHKKVLKKKLLA